MTEPPEECGATKAQCVCLLAPHDDSIPHECMKPTVDGAIGCGGSWWADGEVLRYPRDEYAGNMFGLFGEIL